MGFPCPKKMAGMMGMVRLAEVGELLVLLL
jgi:hypothetical protein